MHTHTHANPFPFNVSTRLPGQFYYYIEIIYNSAYTKQP